MEQSSVLAPGGILLTSTMLVSMGMNSSPQCWAVKTLVVSMTSQVTLPDSTCDLILVLSVGPSCRMRAPDSLAKGSIAACVCPSWKMPP
jgi:hypothetical protein